MRTSPVNHLATAAIALLTWGVSVVWGAAYLADDVSFQDVFPEDFRRTYWGVMTALLVVVIAQASHWYAYGARSATATALPKAKRRWVTTWMVQFVLAAASVVVIVLLYQGQLFETSHFLLMFGLSSLQTWITFWVGSYLMSPRTVQYIPWGKG